MSTFERGPLQTFEVTWTSGHVERIRAHQVTMPHRLHLFGEGQAQGPERVSFHGEIDGNWVLILSTLEQDIRTIRVVTADEPIPGSQP